MGSSAARAAHSAHSHSAAAFDHALTLLAPHAREIRAAWKKSLHLDRICEGHVTRLLRLEGLPPERGAAHATKAGLSDGEIEVCREFAREGIPVETLAAATALYVEACLPWLGGNSDQAIALFRWAARRQIELLSAFGETSEANVSRARIEARQFSARLADDYEKERRRLAHDLHDEIGHDLIVLKLYTENIARDLRKGNTEHLPRKLKDSISLIKHALAGVRSLTFDLGPTVWDSQGFVAAVRAYTRQFERRTGIKVRLQTARLRGEVPPSCETALYKVLQGAMSNVIAHSGAKNVTVVLSRTNGEICMQIADDGRGFDVSRKLRARSHSFGLRAIKSRIELLGGRVEFKSTSVGQYQGTTIRVCVPVNDVESDEGTRDGSGL